MSCDGAKHSAEPGGAGMWKTHLGRGNGEEQEEGEDTHDEGSHMCVRIMAGGAARGKKTHSARGHAGRCAPAKVTTDRPGSRTHGASASPIQSSFVS